MQGMLTRAFTIGIGLALISATPASAQIKWQLGLGPIFPQGSFGDGYSTGLHGMAGANFGLTRAPISFRIDGTYSSNKCDAGGCGDQSLQIFTASGDVQLNFPTPSNHPYLIGGITWGRSKLGGNDAPSGADAQTDIGFNVGGGLHFPLGGNKLFIEARYFEIEDLSFVPITFGVRF